MEAIFNYINSNLIYPDCEEINDTYIIGVTRKVSQTRTQALFDYLSNRLEVLGKQLSKGTAE